MERLGHRVDSVKDGREAVDAWRTGRYDLILMDCQMPVLDGYAATREIRRAENGERHIRIVALTAHAMKGDDILCRQAVGGDMHFGQELLDAFIASGSDRLDEIRDALTDNDMPRLTRAAHAVKGPGASMHAEEVRRVAARLESAAQAGTNQSLAQLVRDLSQALERAIAQLRPLGARNNW